MALPVIEESSYLGPTFLNKSMHTQQVESVAHSGAPELVVVVCPRRAGRPGQAGHPGQPGRQGDVGGGQEQAARHGQQPLRRPPQLTRRGRRSVSRNKYRAIHMIIDMGLR